ALAVVAIISLRLLPVAAHRARLMYWQNRCLTYSPPSGVWVTPKQKHVVRDWTAFYALLSPPGLKSDGTIFLHERRTPSGKRRLVSADVIYGTGNYYTNY